MTYTKKQFIEDVKKEARALRKHATKEEINRLSIARFDPDYPGSCIYGQMTGTCRSPRASELIFSCCKRFFDMPNDSPFISKNFPSLRKQVNGRKIKGVSSAEEFKDTRQGAIRHFSSIEAYILLPNAKNKNLIAYLKGETSTLNL